MKALKDLKVFITTAKTGSLTAAARRHNMTPAAASAALKRLESELGRQLVVRSTRSLRLTAEGELFLQHARQAIETLETGSQALNTGQEVIRGTIQLSAPSDFGRNVLLDWLDAFMTRYPEVTLRLQLSDRVADVFSQPVDVALRYGDLPDASYIALPLAPDNRRVICASPEYVRRVGAPASLDELKQHNCLCFILGDHIKDRWRLYGPEGEYVVQVSGNRSADDGEAVRRWALAGLGVAYKSGLDVAADLKAGRLVRLCPQWRGESAPLHLICVDRRQLTPAVRALRDFLAERCTELALT